MTDRDGANPAPPAARARGITLLETGLAAAILGGVAWLALARAREARIRSNEAGAINVMRHLDSPYDPSSSHRARIAKAEVRWEGSSGHAVLVNQGYRLEWDMIATLREPWIHTIRATPVDSGSTGHRFFFSRGGRIRFRLGAPASSADSPIE